MSQTRFNRGPSTRVPFATNREITIVTLTSQSYLCLLLLLALGTGCVSTPRGRFVKDWSLMMREMHLTPAFPPREDIQPGDIYAEMYRDAKSEDEAFDRVGFLAIAPRLWSVNLTNEIEGFYSKRYDFPKTPVATPDSGIASNSSTIKTDDTERHEAVYEDSTIFKIGQKHRLRSVAFPEFSFTDIHTGNLSALVPIDGISVLLGAAWSRYTSVSLRMRASESYGLPAGIVFDSFKQEMKNNANCDVIEAVWENDRKARLITEVYATREIEVKINRKKSANAAGGVKTSVDMASEWATLPIAERLAKLEAFNKALMEQKDPGGYFKLSSVSDSEMTLKRVYFRPIVVGYRFITITKIAKDQYSAGWPESGISPGVSPSKLKPSNQ